MRRLPRQVPRVRPLVGLLLLLLPSGLALDVTASDPVGDGRITPLHGEPGAGDSDDAPDLRTVRLSEEQDLLRIDVAARSSDGDAMTGDWQSTRVNLSVGTAQYLVAPGATGEGLFALYAAPEGDTPRYIADLDPWSSVGETEHSMGIPRHLVPDEDGAPARAGAAVAVTEVRVESPYQRVLSVRLQGIDPLDDPSPLQGVLEVGAPTTDDLRLHSTRPFRSSNGEVGTFVYDLVLGNEGDRAHDVLLDVAAAPEGWEVFVPAGGRFHLPAGGTVTTFAIVTTPFQHDHGSSETVRMRIGAGGQEATVDLGVRFLAVAQPTGHHDTLYLHSRSHDGGNPLGGEPRVAFMSALAEDPLDEGVAVRAGATVRPLTEIDWDIHLDPGLAVGLQFDPARLGRLTLDLTADLPLHGATLDASLEQVVGAERTRLAGVETLALGDLAAGQTVSVDEPVTADAGLVPYLDGSDLALRVVVTTARPVYLLVDELPLLEPGGRLRLPLLEYNDPLPEGLSAGLDLALSAATTQRLANPGDVVVFEADLTNTGDGPRALRMTLQGAGRTAAHLPTDSLRLDPGESRATRFQVAVPETAVQNDLLEVVLVAAHDDEEALASLLRFAVVVDEREEHPSDAPLSVAADARDAPAPFAPMLLALLAFALRRR